MFKRTFKRKRQDSREPAAAQHVQRDVEKDYELDLLQDYAAGKLSAKSVCRKAHMLGLPGIGHVNPQQNARRHLERHIGLTAREEDIFWTKVPMHSKKKKQP